MVSASTRQVVHCSNRYEVSFDEADHHVINVQLWLRAQGASALEIVFPVWTPGSYMIREYARSIEQLSASAHGELGSDESHAVSVEHLDKHRWLIHTDEAEWI